MFKRILYILLGIVFIYIGIYTLRAIRVFRHGDSEVRMFFPNEQYVGKLVSANLTPGDRDSISYRILFVFKLTFYRTDEFDDLLIADINNSIPSGNLGWADDYEGYYTYLKRIPRYKKVVERFKVSPNTFVLVLTDNLNPKVLLGVRILGYIWIILGIYLIYRHLIRRVVRI